MLQMRKHISRTQTTTAIAQIMAKARIEQQHIREQVDALLTNAVRANDEIAHIENLKRARARRLQSLKDAADRAALALETAKVDVSLAVGPLGEENAPCKEATMHQTKEDTERVSTKTRLQYASENEQSDARLAELQAQIVQYQREVQALGERNQAVKNAESNALQALGEMELSVATAHLLVLDATIARLAQELEQARQERRVLVEVARERLMAWPMLQASFLRDLSLPDPRP